MYNCILETSGVMSRLFGYTSAAVERDAAAVEAFENKKIETQANYWYVYDSSSYLMIFYFKR